MSLRKLWTQTPAVVLVSVIIASTIAMAMIEGRSQKITDDSVAMVNPLTYGLAVGQTAPDIELRDVYSKPGSLNGFRCKQVVLAFFCGCDRCHVAAREIAIMQRHRKLENLVAVVSMDRNGAAEFQAETGIQGTILVDPTDHTAETYQSEFCPRFWIIDADGKIRYKSGIALEGRELELGLEHLSESSHQ